MKKIKPLKSNAILVVEQKNFHIKLSVVKKGKVQHSVKCINFDAVAGVTECLNRFKATKVKVPKDAVLISTEVFPSLLAVEIDKAQPDEYIEQMLTWERQAVDTLAETPTGLDVLLTPGFLEQAVYDRLYNLVLAAKAEVSLPPSLNDLVSSEIINTSEKASIDEYLTKWPRIDELNRAAWNSEISKEVATDTVLVSFAAQHFCSEWSEYFKDHKITLHSVQPWHMNTLGLIDRKRISNCNYALIEFSLGIVHVTVFEQGNIKETQVYGRNDLKIPDALISDLAFNYIDTVSVIGLEDGFEKILKEVKLEDENAVLKSEIHLSESKAERWPALAAVHNVSPASLKSSYRFPTVSCLPPPIPFLKRPSNWWVAFLAISLTLFGFLFYGSYKSIKSLETEINTKQTELNGMMAKEKVIRDNHNEFRDLEKKLNDLASGSNKAKTVSNKVTLNNRKSIFILGRLAESIRPQMILGSLKLLTKEGQFQAEGFFESPVGFYSFLEDFTNLPDNSAGPGLYLLKQNVKEKYLRDHKVYEFTLNMEFE